MAKRSTLDVIREEQQRRGFGQALDSFILLRDPGDEVALRFLDELESKDENDKRVARTFKAHDYGGKFDRKNPNQPYQSILCDGPGCQYCADDNFARQHVVIRAWIYDDNVIKLFDAKARSQVIIDLADDFEKYGSITNADYRFQRRKSSTNPYRLTREEEIPLKKQVRRQIKEQWFKGKRVRELVEARYKPWGGAEEKGKGDGDEE